MGQWGFIGGESFMKNPFECKRSETEAESVEPAPAEQKPEWSTEYRLEWTIWILCMGLLAGMALSRKLWIVGDRLYPVIPFIGETPFPDWLHALMSISLVMSVTCMALRKGRRNVFAAMCVTLSVFLAVMDQTRLQPWFYQYTLMLLPFIHWKSADRMHSADRNLIMTSMQMIMIGIYFWAGFHKLGTIFPTVWTDSVAAPLLEKLSGRWAESVQAFGTWIPWIEILTGLFLIIPATRIIGVLLALGMHITILVLIGPFMSNSNSVIWPWNITMMGLVWVLFSGNKRPFIPGEWPASLLSSRCVIALLALLVWVLPFFSTYGIWDKYLSFHLYSGTGHRYSLILNSGMEEKLPFRIRKYVTPATEMTYAELNAGRWSMQELNVPPVSEGRVMIKWCRAMMKFGFVEYEAFIHHDAPYLKNKAPAKYSPKELSEMSQIPPLPNREVHTEGD